IAGTARDDVAAVRRVFDVRANGRRSTRERLLPLDVPARICLYDPGTRGIAGTAEIRLSCETACEDVTSIGGLADSSSAFSVRARVLQVRSVIFRPPDVPARIQLYEQGVGLAADVVDGTSQHEPSIGGLLCVINDDTIL